jgi:phenylacetic acid degradation operon negative regulatory protein
MLPAILAGLRAQPSRTGSLIITLFGDCIVPRGGEVWLGTLLALFRAIEIGDGVVRTAVSRLATDGWLARKRVGRNSFYQLAQRGLRETVDATPRIYGRPSLASDGRLRMVLVDMGPERETLRESLISEGYGTASPGLMVAPGTGAMTGAGGALTFRIEADQTTLRRLAQRAWPLDALATQYRQLLETFRADPPPLDPEAAMIARLLVIHEWRRIILRDPLLPADALPDDWPGATARARVATLYEAFYASSEAWLDAFGRAEDGALPAPDPRLRHVFA